MHLSGRGIPIDSYGRPFVVRAAEAYRSTARRLFVLITQFTGFPLSAYKQFHNFSRTLKDPQNVFQDSVEAKQCLSTDKQQLLTLYIHSVTVQSIAKRLLQVAKN